MISRLRAPAHWSDPRGGGGGGQSLGQEYSNVSLGGTVSGPLKYDKAFYNVAYQLGRRSNDLQTLLNTDSRGLEALGVSSDSVSRLLSILNTARVPLTTGASGDNRIGDQGSIFGNLDFAPRIDIGHAWNVSSQRKLEQAESGSVFATEVPAIAVSEPAGAAVFRHGRTPTSASAS